MSPQQPHICVCVCTYKRREYLKRLLSELALQDTDGLFTYSIVIADNDRERSAEAVVAEFAATSSVPVTYCVEPCQGIPMARNKAVANASGDFIAFIDDDEFPVRHWLQDLFRTVQAYSVDAVLGPIEPRFDTTPAKWLIEGGFHNRPNYRTGQRLEWWQCRTGNALVKAQLFAGRTEPFLTEFLSGEDQNFFRRMSEEGYKFVFCSEAVVYEAVPAQRCRRSFLVRRALFRGMFSLRNHRFAPMRVLQSAIAAPAYAAALPIALLAGQTKFMRYAFQMSYHVGRLLAIVGVNPIRARYVID
jgi:succinoglycan biosynthesis protein ExoM